MKENYRLEMQAKIDALEKQMGEIRARVKTGGDAQKREYESHLADFQAQKDKLLKKLIEIDAAPEADWQGHKKEAEGLYANLSRYIGKIYAKYTGSGGTGMF